MSEQQWANHPHLMLQLPGTWQSASKLTQTVPSYLADLLSVPLASIRVYCCVDIRAQVLLSKSRSTRGRVNCE